MDTWFGPGGTLHEKVDGCSFRPQQLAYARAVDELLRGGGVRFVEGGTGVGKTFGYLVPHILAAKRTGGKVLVCTRTKNLQDQVFLRDLPRLAGLFNFSYALLKGRENYACRERLEEEWDRQQLFIHSPEHRTIRYLRHFDRLHATGDLEAAWSFLRRWGPDAWRAMSDIRALDDVCVSDHRNTCRHFRALAAAEKADVIVANHHLALLWPESYPSIRYLVIDEAHALEEAATDICGPAFCTAFLHRRIRRLHAGAARPRGTTLGRLSRQVWKEYSVQPVADSLDTVRDWSHHFDVAAQAFSLKFEGPRQRVTDERLADPAWRTLCDNAEMLGTMIAGAVAGLQRLQKELSAVESLKTHAERVARAGLGLGEVVMELNALFKRIPEEGTVLWYETRAGRAPLFKRSPIAVGTWLESHLYRKFHSVLLTSATLQSGGGFEFLAERLGLVLPSSAPAPTTSHASHAPGIAASDTIDTPAITDDAAPVRDGDEEPPDEEPIRVLAPVTVGHPFNYRENVLLCLLRTPLTGPSAIADQLSALAAIAGGRTLGLFTNKKRMLEAAELVSVPGCEVMAQYRDGSRHELAARLRRHPSTVLMGTRSFWEGIDVPGGNLSLVVMEKIPFASPGEPVYDARCAALGDKWFPRYALPLALLSLRQGFGRLIRTETDRGVVVILDPGRKSYTRRLLATLPSCLTVEGDTAAVRAAVDAFLHGRIVPGATLPEELPADASTAGSAGAEPLPSGTGPQGLPIKGTAQGHPQADGRRRR